MISNPFAVWHLNKILKELRNFLSNNYKDAAHEQRQLLGETSEAYYKQGKLSRRKYMHYRKLYSQYSRKESNTYR